MSQVTLSASCCERVVPVLGRQKKEVLVFKSSRKCWVSLCLKCGQNPRKGGGGKVFLGQYYNMSESTKWGRRVELTDECIHWRQWKLNQKLRATESCFFKWGTVGVFVNISGA